MVDSGGLLLFADGSWMAQSILRIEWKFWYEGGLRRASRLPILSSRGIETPPEFLHTIPYPARARCSVLCAARPSPCTEQPLRSEVWGAALHAEEEVVWL